MNLFPGQRLRRAEEYAARQRRISAAEHSREVTRQAAAAAQQQREADKQRAKADMLANRADQLLAMSPDDHREAAALLIAAAETSDWEHRVSDLLKANAHLALAQTDRRSS